MNQDQDNSVETLKEGEEKEIKRLTKELFKASRTDVKLSEADKAKIENMTTV